MEAPRPRSKPRRKSRRKSRAARLMGGGLSIDMAGGRTALHLAAENGNPEALFFFGGVLFLLYLFMLFFLFVLAFCFVPSSCFFCFRDLRKNCKATDESSQHTAYPNRGIGGG